MATSPPAGSAAPRRPKPGLSTTPTMLLERSVIATMWHLPALRRYVLSKLRHDQLSDVDAFSVYRSFEQNRPVAALPFSAVPFVKEDLDAAIDQIKEASWFRAMQGWSLQLQQAAERHDADKLSLLLRAVPLRDTENQHVTAEAATTNLTNSLLIDDQNVVRPVSPALQPLNLVFYPNSVYLIGAKPGTGKSALGEQILLDLTDQGAFCLDVSVELNETTRTQRYHQHIGGVNFSPRAYNEFTFDPDQLEHVTDTFSYVPDPNAPWLRDVPRRLTIDARSVSIEQVMASIKLWLHDIRELQAQLRDEGVRDTFGPPVVMIDFLQIMSAAGHGDIYAKMNTISEQLYELAKEEEISLLWISQLRKDDKQRDPHAPPSVEDLEGTARLHQLSHHVLLLHRPITGWSSGDWSKVMAIAPKVRTGEMYHLDGAFNGKTLTFNFDPLFLAGLPKTASTVAKGRR
jgi:hypothetical protein